MDVDGSLDRTDRRLLADLNAGGVLEGTDLSGRIARLKDSGLVEETSFGTVVITARGQLELMRWRYRNLPRPSQVVLAYTRPWGNLWGRLFS